MRETGGTRGGGGTGSSRYNQTRDIDTRDAKKGGGEPASCDEGALQLRRRLRLGWTGHQRCDKQAFLFGLGEVVERCLSWQSPCFQRKTGGKGAARKHKKTDGAEAGRY